MKCLLRVLATGLMIVPMTSLAVDTDAVVGGALGGGLGAAVGSELGNREGAIVGGAIGAGIGTAIFTEDRDRDERHVHEVVVHEEEVPHQVIYYNQYYRPGPPPHAYRVPPGHAKHWKHRYRYR
jgi:hypothetical protein